jgi:hypothetical protein
MTNDKTPLNLEPVTVWPLAKLRAIANERRIATDVHDATTNEILPGVPHPLLFARGLGKVVLAKWSDGQWVPIDDTQLEWHLRQGHEIRNVYMNRDWTKP